MKEVLVNSETEKRIANKNCIVKYYGIVEGQLPLEFANILNVNSAVGIVMHYEAGDSLSSQCQDTSELIFRKRC